MLVDLRSFDAELTGKEAQTVLDRAGITLNRNTIPDDPRSPFVTSGLRIGTAVGHHPGHDRGRDGHHRRAHRPGAARRRADDAELAAVRDEVVTLCSKFTPYP